MHLFKTRSAKIKPLIGATDIEAMLDETKNQPKMDHVFFNVASTDQNRQTNIKSKRAVLTERMDDPEQEICELSPLSVYYLTGTIKMDLTSSRESPRAFYRKSMDFCRADFPPPPNFLPSKKTSATETRYDGDRKLQDEEVVWKVNDNHTTGDKTACKAIKWQLRDVDKTSQLRQCNCSISSSIQNSTAQKWMRNPDRFCNCIIQLRNASRLGTSAITADERLKHSLFVSKTPHKAVSFPPEVLLFSCIHENNKDDLEFVLRHSNIDINICFNARQLSPLHLASMYGYTDCVEVLLRYGGNVNYLDPSGHSPLYIAMSRLHFESAVLLIEAGADIQQFTVQKLREFEKVKKAAKRYKGDVDA